MRRDPATVDWDFRPEGHGWGERTWERLQLIGEVKLEVIDGKLVGDAAARLLLFGLLLENVGLDAVVRLGDPEAWRAAVTRL